MAYIARFYYPPGGKRISHQQVYLSDIRGLHRKQLTFASGEGEPWHVRWVGRDHLVRSSGARIFIDMMDLRSWKTRTFGGFREVDAEGTVQSSCELRATVPGAPGDVARGRPIYTIDKNLKELTVEGLRPVSKEQLSGDRHEWTEAGDVWRIPASCVGP